MLLAPAAAAHPHAWIDVQSRLVFDNQDRIGAIEFIWLFDAWYTAVVIDEIEGEVNHEKLQAIARRNIENLEPYAYFTEVTKDGAVVPSAVVTTYDAKLQDARLLMRFVLPLTAPLDPRRSKVAYRAFDPTFYIEMVHARTDPVRFSGEAAKGCGFELIEPRPSEEAVALASSLDRDESAGEELGKLFAETVEIRCR